MNADGLVSGDVPEPDTKRARWILARARQLLGGGDPTKPGIRALMAVFKAAKEYDLKHKVETWPGSN